MLALGMMPVRGQTNSPAVLTNGISLAEVRKRVLDFNESIQMRILGVEISRKKHLLEKGIFEPQLVTSVETLENNRQNTVQQQLSTFTSLFEEKNTIYQGALEMLSPSGGQLRLGYTMRDLSNNLQANRNVGNEYETFIGASLVQPLLKNMGPAATLAKIRLAAVDSDIAYQDYRRQVMLVVARAEVAYWDLYLGQEQLRISSESVALAETILKDNRSRLEVGKSSDLEVLESQAGVALRRFRRNDAQQKHFDAMNRLTTSYSDSALETNLIVSASDHPEVRALPESMFENYRQAFEYNPDYLTKRKQVLQEEIRLAYAQNQRWPQLDLKASYGLNGLGDSPDSSWSHVEKKDFPSWAVGLEMRIPLGGGVRERHQLSVAKLTQRQALIGLKEVELQVVNSIDLAMRKARAFRENIDNYQAVVDFNQKLLETQMARLDVGKADSRTVLETEEKLSEAKIAVIDSLVQYQKALLELELVTGTNLRARQLEVSKRDLLARTALFLKAGEVSDQVLENMFRDVRGRYDQKPASADSQNEALRLLRQKVKEADASQAPPLGPMSPAMEKAFEQLREKFGELQPKAPAAKPLTPEQQKALDELRQKMKELESAPAPRN